MQPQTTTTEDYIRELPEETKETFLKLRDTLLKNFPEGFEETMSYGMIGYVVPHKTYPAGYHCNPKEPLPFAGLASRKNTISFYHMGLYADKALLDWFVGEYPKHSKYKLDMGKSCIRFKKPEAIPFDLLAILVQKLTVRDWIALYESQIK